MLLDGEDIPELVEEGDEGGVELVLHQTGSRPEGLLRVALLCAVFQLQKQVFKSSVDFDQFLGLFFILYLGFFHSIENVHILRVLSIHCLEILLQKRGDFQLYLGLAVRVLPDRILPN